MQFCLSFSDVMLALVQVMEIISQAHIPPLLMAGVSSSGSTSRSVVATAEVGTPPRSRSAAHVVITGAIAHATCCCSRRTEEQAPISGHVPTGKGDTRAGAGSHGVIVQVV